VIAWNPETEEILSGQFDTPEGFEHWLIKFDGVEEATLRGAGSEYGRREYAYHLMASAAGIAMSPSRLLPENGRAHFMTRRFDRVGNTKLHLQSLCAMDHLDYQQIGTHAYEQYFMAIQNLGLGDEALAEAFRRVAFNVAARNCDDHSKNFGFILPKGGKWALAPAYDITFAFNPNGTWNKQHLMSVNGKFIGIAREDILTLASRFSVPGAKAILGKVHDALDSWVQFAGKAGLSTAMVDRVAGNFQRLG
jgi:serine/threonine-protein kinase HipA